MGVVGYISHMTDNDTELSARPVDIQELLADPGKQYVTPDFQRDFEWGEEEYDQLWADILTANERGDQHFLGQIIVVEGGGDKLSKIKLIDGQQRLTSIIILSCAMRDVYRQEHDDDLENVKNQIEQLDRLVHVTAQDGKKHCRLTLENNDSSDEKLQQIIESESDSEGGVVGSCYRFFKNKMSGLSLESLSDIRQTLLTEVQIIRTSTGDINSAYQVFQTQNDRGMQLSVIDLAKSVTFETAAMDTTVDSEHIKEMWLQLTETLDKVSGPGAKRPITHILGLSKYNCPTNAYPATFIRRYKDIIRTELEEHNENIVDFIEFLDRETAVYFEANAAAVDIANSPLGSDYDQRARQFRYKNPHAGIALYYVYKHHKDNEQLLYKLLDLLTILNVRLNLNDATQSAKRDPIYTTVRNLSDTDNTIETLKRMIRSQTPSDAAIREYITTRDFKQNDITRLVLLRLEQDHFSNRNIRINDFQIEHIAPRKAFSKDKYTTWRGNFQHDEGRFNQFCDRIGNLTLLDQRQNARAGSDPFDQKKRAYESSEYVMTNRICDYDDWSYDKIEDRSKQLAELIVDSWSIE